MNAEALHALAYDPAAPTAERQAAGAELAKAYVPYTGEMIPTPEIQRVVDYIQDQYEDAALFAKAKVIRFPGSNQREPRQQGPQSAFLDPYSIVAYGDYFERPSMQFELMRRMVDETPVLGAVIFTRMRQVQRFCAPQEDDGPGFSIRHIDREHQANKAELAHMQELMRFLQHCGGEHRPLARKKLGRDNFASFVAKVARDSLILDAAAIETERKLGGKREIQGIYAVDGSTIRLCTEDGYKGDDRFFAVQVVQGNLVTAYTYDDLIYEPRNDNSDIRRLGYGLSEVELLIKVVTGFLNAMTLNLKGFSDNAIPKGILHLVGDYAEADLAAFKRYWSAMVKGVNNAWSLPVMTSRDPNSKAEFAGVGIEFNEMYFSKWMTFLTSMICALYGMSPAEINFDSFTAGNTSALSGSDTAEKIASSKDSGLRPLMSYLENLFSDYIIADFDENLVFRWTGLEPADQEKRHELRKLVLTVDEIRAQEGYDAMEDKQLGSAPINPSLVGPWMQISGIGGMGGGPGGEPGGAEEQGQPQPDEQGGNDDRALLEQYLRGGEGEPEPEPESLAKAHPVFVIEV